MGGWITGWMGNLRCCGWVGGWVRRLGDGQGCVAMNGLVGRVAGGVSEWMCVGGCMGGMGNGDGRVESLA